MGYLSILSLVAIVSVFSSVGSNGWGSIKIGPYIYEWYGILRENWDEAAAICEFKGGILVDVESEDENNLVLTIMRVLGYYERVWIGRHGRFNQSVLMLEENGGYTNWATGEPSKHGDSKVCVTIDPRSGEWYTDSCGLLVFHPWICKYGKVVTTTPMTSTSTEEYSTTNGTTGNETSTVPYNTTIEPAGNETSTIQYSTTNQPTGNATSPEVSETNETIGN